MTKTANISTQECQHIVEMIQAAQGRALAAVNTELVTLYWNVGKYVSQKVSPLETQLQRSDCQYNTKVPRVLTQIVLSAFDTIQTNLFQSLFESLGLIKPLNQALKYIKITSDEYFRLDSLKSNISRLKS